MAPSERRLCVRSGWSRTLSKDVNEPRLRRRELGAHVVQDVAAAGTGARARGEVETQWDAQTANIVKESIERSPLVQRSNKRLLLSGKANCRR